MKRADEPYRAMNLMVDSTVIAVITALYAFVTNDVYVLVSFYFFAFFCYFIFEIKYQKTIGKMLTNTKVVRLDGDKPIFRNIAPRKICRFLPFDLFSYLVGYCGFHGEYFRTMTIIDEDV